MDSQTIDTIVNHVSEKIGIAAEKLMPIADRAVDEIAFRGLGMMTVLLILAIVIAFAVVSIITAILSIGKWLPEYFAPTITLIEKIIS